MKKLLSLLTITTLTASVPAPLLANTVQTRVKRDVGATEKYKEQEINGSDINLELIRGVSIGTKIFGGDRNTYLKLIEDDTWYLYKNKVEDEKSYSNIAVVDFLKKSNKLIFAYPIFKDVTTGFDIKIKEKLNKWEEVEAENKPFNSLDDKWYVVIWRGKENLEWKIFKLKNDEKIRLKNSFKLVLDYYGKVDDPNKINLVFDAEINNLRANDQIWTNNSINFKSVYRWDGVGEPNLPEINSSTGEITDWKQPTKNNFQQGISFSLMDGSKTATWSNAGMRLTVDGETNININNSNVEEVYWDGAKQNILEHKVKINVKPETSEKTHKLVIKYDINGTKYTSEDIDIVMAAKIEPPKPIVKENLSDVIKFVNNNDLGNIIDKNDDAIKAAITQKNSRKVDFSQIKITDKTDTQATLSTIEGSKSYTGSVDVSFNVIPATIVDLKIDLTSSASGIQIDSDYLVQLDSSKMTNKVDTFYYANGKSTIKIKQPSTGNVIIGKIYGCDEQ